MRSKAILTLFAPLLGLGLLTASCQPSKPAGATTPPPRDGVFIHISHGKDDPHRLLMGLNMAALMSADKDVLVYVDIKGVYAFLKDAEDVQMAPFPSSKTSIQKLLSANVTIYVCPGCLKKAGKSAADLAPGIKVAQKKGFFSFTRGRILSLSY